MKKIVTMMAIVMAASAVHAEEYQGVMTTSSSSKECPALIGSILKTLRKMKADGEARRQVLHAELENDAKKDPVLAFLIERAGELKAFSKSFKDSVEMIGERVDNAQDTVVNDIQAKLREEMSKTENGRITLQKLDAIDAAIDASQASAKAGLAETKAFYSRCGR